MPKTLIRLAGISKRYRSSQILDDVTVNFHLRRITCLIGENGAGKTTIVRILMGITSPDSGTLEIDGKNINHQCPDDAHRSGFRMVPQEPELVEDLSVVENLFLNGELTLKFGLLDRRSMINRAMEILQKLNCHIDPDANVSTLSYAEKKKISIAVAVVHDPDVLILDEPTNSMVHVDVEALMQLLYELKERGTGIIFISHRLRESLVIADDIVVLRDGCLIRSDVQSRYSSKSLLTDITGDDLLNRYPKTSRTLEGAALTGKGLTTTDGRIDDFDITLKNGEILGITGLQGALKSDIGRILFGLQPLAAGSIRIGGTLVELNTPSDAITAGIAYISDDISNNLDKNLNCIDNINIINLDRCAHGPFLNPRKARDIAFEHMLKLNYRSSVDMTICNMNRGSQQKVAIAKWLNADSRIFIFDEPTQSLDIPSKVDFYIIVNRIAEDGKCVILISSDFEEILGMSDRIIVMHEGCIVKTLANKNLSSRDLLGLASMLDRENTE